MVLETIKEMAMITVQDLVTIVTMWDALERLPIYQTHQRSPASQQSRSPLTSQHVSSSSHL